MTEHVTIEDVREALKHDELTGKLVNATAAYRLQAQYVTLFDPPIDGVTPVDGEGEPMTSDVQATNALAALGQGFTEKPVGHGRGRRSA